MQDIWTAVHTHRQTVCIRVAVGMGIPVGIPTGIGFGIPTGFFSGGMEWVLELK